MHGQDRISIVLFNDYSLVLKTPTAFLNKSSLIELIHSVNPGGKTNLYAGLEKGYELVSSILNQQFENRVILISDAGLNTGHTSESDNIQLVEKYAFKGIGLTAIGMGENFNKSLIDAITSNYGGNYIFIQSGEALQDHFSQFDFLVSPIAYNFRASLAIPGYRLTRAYGIPTEHQAVSDDLFKITSLFFSSVDRGGAILLEYQRTEAAKTEL